MPSGSAHTVRVAIICQLDPYANGLKLVAMERFPRDRGHDVVAAPAL